MNFCQQDDKNYYMKRILLVIQLLIITGITLSAQTLEKNLQKYWNYRDRLRKYFVVISNTDGPGTNIPAISLNPTSKTLHWGDGNGTHQYYIGLLATEYALLAQSGLDVTQTRNELLYTLKALKRLDVNAEKWFRPNGEVQSGDYNGFFLRDDIPSNLCNQYASSYPQLAGCNVSSCFSNNYNSDPSKIGNDFVNSKDNVWHFLINLALVKALVSDAEIKSLAKDIAYRMVNAMPGYTDNGWLTRWHIENPVTRKVISGKQDVDEIPVTSEYAMDGFRYGFFVAQNWISGRPEGDETYPDIWAENRPVIRSISDFRDNFYSRAANTNFMGYVYDNYSYLSLMTVGGEENHFSLSNYKFLINNRDNNAYSPKMPYEHFALIYEVLHGIAKDFDPSNNGEYNHYMNLLNSAPDCGTYNFGQSNYAGLPAAPFEWSTNNRLVWPENLGKTENYGYYNNGIDYMLLHNLFWLAHIHKVYYNAYNGLPMPFIGLPSGTYSNPFVMAAQNKLYEFGVIQSGGGKIDVAGSKVILKTGFKVNQGGYYKGSVSNTMAYMPEFAVSTPNSGCSIVLNSSKSGIIDNEFIFSKEKYSKPNDNPIADISIFPNPAVNILNIKFAGNNDKAKASIYTIDGKLVLSRTLSSSSASINISALKQGMYILKISNQSKTSSMKFTKRQS